MKTLRKNVQDFKTYMLTEQAKHSLVKHNANLSTNSNEFDWDKRSTAQCNLEGSRLNMFVINLAYYIVKHHLDEKQISEYLKKTAETAKNYYFLRLDKETGEYRKLEIPYQWLAEKGRYAYDAIMKLVNKYTYEESTDNN